jgi:hypothetical protein
MMKENFHLQRFDLAFESGGKSNKVPPEHSWINSALSGSAISKNHSL